jgi:hypothetical protein
MAINLIALKEELTLDPMGLGYAPFILIRDDVSLKNLMNEIRGGQDFLVSRGRITKDAFIELTSQMVFALMLASKSGDTEADFWLSVFDRLVANADTINVDDPSLESVLDQMISANYLTQQDKESIKTRQGSRAEILFGINVLVDDISNSLNEVEI